MALDVHIHDTIFRKIGRKDTHQFQGIAFVWEAWKGNENREGCKGVFSCISSVLFLKKIKLLKQMWQNIHNF